LSFYYKNMSNVEDQRVALDNVSLIGADEYTYAEPFFPRVDFETGTLPPGWSVLRGGGASQDWSLSDGAFHEPFHGTSSAWCLSSPDPAQVPDPVPFGGWVEFRSPYMTLNGSYWLRFARLSGIAAGSAYEARLLNTQVQVVQTLGSMPSGWVTNDRYVRFPASYANSIAIGAATDNDRYANYSCYYPPFNPTITGVFCVAPSNEGWNDMTTLDIAGAPGQNSGNARFKFGGTSAAAPCAAGVAALILSKNSTLTLQQLKDAVQNGCEQVGGEPYTGGKALHYGYGRVNAYNSLTVTAADTTAPVVSSVVTRTGRQVEVTFSEKMGSGVTTPGNYTLAGTGKGTLASNPASVSWVSGYKYLLEWSGGEMIAGTGNLTITVGSAVKDVAGNGVGSPNFGNANGSRVIHAIDCGRVLSNATDPIYPFESERNYWSGIGVKNSTGIDSIINSDGTPIAVYKTERNIYLSQNYPGDIVYTLPNITAGLNHTVRLYFANDGFSIHPGDVIFDIYINDVLRATNFDLIGQAGGSHIGIWRDYPNITPNGSGRIIVKIVAKMSYNQTWPGYFYNAALGGIKATAQ
jgi:hypothetical protein